MSTADSTRRARGTVPSAADFARLARPGTIVPVVRELDVEALDAAGVDPLVAFAALAEGETHAALLETAEAGSGDADVSIVVPRAVARVTGPTVLEAARSRIVEEVVDIGVRLPRFIGGMVGMLGHEIASVFEPRVPLAGEPHPAGLPVAQLLEVEETVVFEHRAKRVLAVVAVRISPLRDHDDGPTPDRAEQYADAVAALDRIELRLTQPAPAVAQVALAAPEPDPLDSATTATPNMTRDDFEAMVRAAREQVLSGEVVQIVVSQRFDRDFDVDPIIAYRALRAVAPAPYHVLLRLGDAHIVGASPEQLVGVHRERVVTHPIAGTRPRGATTEADVALERELLADPKERAEHMMLVDLGRNDVGRVAVPGSVHVPLLCNVERFSHVMHLVSRVEGDLAPGRHPIDALESCFPAGTLTGAPKVRALELIAQLERDQRGPYGGVVGYIGHGRVLDMAITIRTALLANGRAHVQTGAGIVAASVPALEYAETHAKARSVLTALELAAATGRLQCSS
ncbi:MAG: anthranilate synthase component I family protein [Thermoleophilia bacterium]|nr:anthranilate synthase component I family protein [Thermoleophilia bacterium]